MYSLESVKQAVERMDDQELAARIHDGMFSDEARTIAQEEFQRRKLDPELLQRSTLEKPQYSLVRSIPVLLVLIAQIVFILLAFWQVWTLWPSVTWLANPADITFGLWMMLGIKCFVLILSVVLAHFLGKLRKRLKVWSQR